jgi:sugar phosphate permease
VLGDFALEGAALKQRHQVLVLIALLSAISYLDRVCISIAGPRIQQALGLTPVQWGWLGSLFAISYAMFEIPSGVPRQNSAREPISSV